MSSARRYCATGVKFEILLIHPEKVQSKATNRSLYYVTNQHPFSCDEKQEATASLDAALTAVLSKLERNSTLKGNKEQHRRLFLVKKMFPIYPELVLARV